MSLFRNIYLQVGVLTVAFGSIYPLARSLPDTECAFLHYEQETPDNEEAFCGDDSNAVYLELDRLRFPVEMTAKAAGEPAAGQRAFVTLSLKTLGGRPITPGELAIVHTERLHLLVVDPSLEDYQHIHPEPLDAESGQFGFDFVPQKGGAYRVIAEMVSKRSRSAVVAETVLPVAGEPEEPELGRRLISEVGGYRFALDFVEGAPVLGSANDVRLRVERADGGQEPIGFEKTMDAYAHTVAFDAEHQGYAHMHPIDDGVGLDGAQPSFGFVLNTHLAGDYRVWAQVMIDGQEHFAPFDISIQ